MIKKLWAIIMNEAIPTCPVCHGRHVTKWEPIVCTWLKSRMHCWDCGRTEPIQANRIPWSWLEVRR